MSAGAAGVGRFDGYNPDRLTPCSSESQQVQDYGIVNGVRIVTGETDFTTGA